jgi:LPXTG-site transpeptidase (sortase) family protein
MLSKYLRKITSVKAGFITGIIVLAISLFVGGFSLFNTWRHQQGVAPISTVEALKSNQPVENQEPEISGRPVHITIPSQDIDLSVIPGYYYPSNKSWTLSLNNAQYATMTAPANNKSGDTFIYAHNRRGVFLNLPKVQPGDIAQVTTNNGHVFIYKFSASTVTTPEDTSLFNYKGKPVLVLQTCTGLWYQNRQLFTFNLVKVDQTDVSTS